MNTNEQRIQCQRPMVLDAITAWTCGLPARAIVLIAWATFAGSWSTAQAQVRLDLERVCVRADHLIETDDDNALQLLADSLGASHAADKQVSVLASLLKSVVLRHNGKANEAYHLVDSITLDATHSDPFILHLLAQENARIFKALMVWPDAENECARAIQLARVFHMRREEANDLVLSAEIHNHVNRYDTAAGELIAAERIARALNDGALQCQVELTWGSTYYHQDKYKEAIQHYRKAYELAVGFYHANISTALLNIGSTEYALYGADSALATYRKVLNAKSINEMDPELLANMGMMHNEKHEYTEARELFKQALEIQRAKGDSAGMASCLSYLATNYWYAHSKDSALVLEQRAIDLASRTGSHELLAEAELKMSEYLSSLGRDKEALVHLQQHLAVKSKLDEVEQGELLNRLEIQYETSKKDEELKANEFKLKVATAQKRRRTMQLFVAAGIALLLLILCAVLVRNLQHRKRLSEQEHILHQQQVNDLLKQQEIRSLDAMMEGQERERKRIAQDLHDRLGSILSAIKLQFGVLEGRIQQLQTDQKEQYQHVFTMLDDAVVEVRRISHDMLRSSITQFGLKGALEDLRNAVTAPGKLEVELSLFGLEQRIDQKVEIAIYRMVQECVSNALKHSKANQISISLTRSAGMLNVIVEDDGAGFDPSKATEGMGLGNIRQRAAEINGVVRVDARQGRGTSVSIDVPLP